MDRGMRYKIFLIAGASLLLHLPTFAINAKYAKQLERSGCTQVSEAQGCDISKTEAENAKAGFVNPATPAEDPSKTSQTPYAGKWVAKGSDGTAIATILIDNQERVKVNAKSVKAKRSDGALIFRDGSLTYTIQGDRRLKGEDVWQDFKAGTKGTIAAE
jgi:hypothetical protein